MGCAWPGKYDKTELGLIKLCEDIVNKVEKYGKIKNS